MTADLSFIQPSQRPQLHLVTDEWEGVAEGSSLELCAA